MRFETALLAVVACCSLASLPLACLSGCGPNQAQTSAGAEVQQGTPWEVNETNITFAPGSCVRGSAGIGWGLGSSQIAVLGRQDGFCVIDYTAEVEGGWSRYRVKVPVTEKTTYIRYQNSINYGTTTASGIVTSFTIDEKNMVEQGNVHFAPPGEEHKVPIQWKQQSVPETDYVNYFYDPNVGQGAQAKNDSQVRVQLKLYCRDDFKEPLIGLTDFEPFEFKVGDGSYGEAIDAAILGMQKDGIRHLRIRTEVCQPLAKLIGGYREHSTMYIELRLLDVNH